MSFFYETPPPVGLSAAIFLFVVGSRGSFPFPGFGPPHLHIRFFSLPGWDAPHRLLSRALGARGNLSFSFPVSLPSVSQIDWGFFFSVMVDVLSSQSLFEAWLLFLAPACLFPSLFLLPQLLLLLSLEKNFGSPTPGFAVHYFLFSFHMTCSPPVDNAPFPFANLTGRRPPFAFHALPLLDERLERPPAVSSVTRTLWNVSKRALSPAKLPSPFRHPRSLPPQTVPSPPLKNSLITQFFLH